MSFGKPNYDKGKGFKKKNYFHIDETEQVFAIFPPMFSLEEKGRWAEFWKVHFGFKNLEGKLRTFLSPEVKNGKTKMIDVPDAALNRINDLKGKMEAAKAEGNTGLYDRLNKLVGMKGVYNLDKNWHMNAHDLSGKIGLLKMRHRCKQALDAEIAKLRAAGVDPLDMDNGRYFVMKRIGTGPDTSYKVDVYQQEVTIEGHAGKFKQEAVRTATADLKSRALDGECADLSTLFQTVTAEECQAIVDSSDLLTGISPVCNQVFDERWKAQRAASGSTPAAAAPAATTATAPKANTTTTSPEDEEPDTDPAPSPALVAATPGPVSVAASTVAQETRVAQATVASAPAPSSFETLSDDDFFAAVGAKKRG